MAGIEIWFKTWLFGNAIAIIWTWSEGLEVVFAVLAVSLLSSIWIILPINILVKWSRNKKSINPVPVTLIVNALLTNFTIFLYVTVITLNLTVGGFRLPWTYMIAFTVSSSIAVLSTRKIKKTTPNKT